MHTPHIVSQILVVVSSFYYVQIHQRRRSRRGNATRYRKQTLQTVLAADEWCQRTSTSESSVEKDRKIIKNWTHHLVHKIALFKFHHFNVIFLFLSTLWGNYMYFWVEIQYCLQFMHCTYTEHVHLLSFLRWVICPL